MAAIGNREHHPALPIYIFTMLLLGLTILLGFIAVFVPWVQKDIAVGTRAWAYPFKTCLQNTFSKVHMETCLDNDFIVGSEGAPLTQGNKTCKAFVLGTIAFVFISVIGGVLLLLLLLGVVLRMWSRPVCLAAFAQVCLILVCISAFIAWILFIFYAEKECVKNSIFPAKGYSYGFILYIFASALSLGSVVTGFLGLSKLRKYEPVAEKEMDEDLATPYSEPHLQYPECTENPTELPHTTPQQSFNAAFY